MYKNIEAIATAGKTSPTNGTKMLGKKSALIETPLKRFLILAESAPKTKNFLVLLFIFSLLYKTFVRKTSFFSNNNQLQNHPRKC